jgi:hypothetical protein
MQRWIARLLALVMVVPALGPLAIAMPTQPMAPHCMRQAAKPIMHCHGMAMTPEPASSETLFRAADSCCENHDCCRGTAAPTWGQPQSNRLSQQNLPTARAPRALSALFAPSTIADNELARAPPRS